MRADGQTAAISTAVAMQATVSIDVGLSLLRIHLVSVFIFFVSREDFPCATTLARSGLWRNGGRMVCTCLGSDRAAL
jgi:hypothetical protein